MEERRLLTVVRAGVIGKGKGEVGCFKLLAFGNRSYELRHTIIRYVGCCVVKVSLGARKKSQVAGRLTDPEVVGVEGLAVVINVKYSNRVTQNVRPEAEGEGFFIVGLVRTSHQSDTNHAMYSAERPSRTPHHHQNTSLSSAPKTSSIFITKTNQ